jgi:hypothetical protein
MGQRFKDLEKLLGKIGDGQGNEYANHPFE